MSYGDFETVEPRALAERLARGDELCLLDVREPEELELARLPNAVHVPLRELPARVDELDPAREVVCVCHHGIRSAHAAQLLARSGFARVWNLAGGVDAWAVEVDPSMGRY